MLINTMHGAMNIKRLHFLLSAANRVSDSEVSAANPSALSLKGSLIEVYSEIYDGWLRPSDN
jgi:hypothetical protein